MEDSQVVEVRSVAEDTELIGTYVPAPGFGVLPVNAFLIRAAQPVLVDAGVVAMKHDFVEALQRTFDLDELRWIWLTHTDPDHVGALWELLEAAPRARVVTTYLGMGKLGLTQPVAPERILLLNPGETLHVGDRSLLAVKPPVYDAPETTGLFDPRTRTLYASDCFGALLETPADCAADIAPSALRDGVVTWTGVDAPWLHALTQAALATRLRHIAELDAELVLSSHLPPAAGALDQLASHLEAARVAAPFVGPDQAALSALLSAA